MAKITSVTLESLPETINVGDDVSDINVLTTIEFHSFDLKFNMEYALHLYVYDMQGMGDTPIIIPNWDEADVHTFAKDNKYDDFLGSAHILITATEKTLTITSSMLLRLGNISGSMSYHSRSLRVFATIAPAMGRASKWSEPFDADLMF